MVAYSFQRRFEAPIITRRKIGTIRDKGKRRHAELGDMLQLYTGMRTKSCRLIATSSCVGNDRVRVCFTKPCVVVGELEDGADWKIYNHVSDFEQFAQADGFVDFDDMARFWWDVHLTSEFDMRWIRWNPESVVTP